MSEKVKFKLGKIKCSRCGGIIYTKKDCYSKSNGDHIHSHDIMCQDEIERLRSKIKTLQEILAYGNFQIKKRNKNYIEKT